MTSTRGITMQVPDLDMIQESNYPEKKAKVLGSMTVATAAICMTSFVVYFSIVARTHFISDTSQDVSTLLLLPGMMNLLIASSGVIAIKAAKNPSTKTITPVLVVNVISSVVTFISFNITIIVILSTRNILQLALLYVIICCLFVTMITQLYLLAIASAAVCCKSNVQPMVSYTRHPSNVPTFGVQSINYMNYHQGTAPPPVPVVPAYVAPAPSIASGSGPTVLGASGSNPTVYPDDSSLPTKY